jgi:hypothetical protein
MDDTEIRDWLFDYCFNGWDINKAEFEDTFSECIDKCSKYEVEYFKNSLDNFKNCK